MKEIVLQILMWIVTGCLYVSYLPQIVKILRTKKAEDLSKASWVLWSISSIADFTYSALLGRVELIIASGSEFALNFTVLFLTVYYTYKNDYYLESEEKFNERIYKIQCHDGNHMVYLSSLVQDRERRKANRKEVWFLKDK